MRIDVYTHFQYRFRNSPRRAGLWRRKADGNIARHGKKRSNIGNVFTENNLLIININLRIAIFICTQRVAFNKASDFSNMVFRLRLLRKVETMFSNPFLGLVA